MLVWTVPTVCDPSWAQDGSSVTNLSVTISTMLVVVCGGGGVGRGTRPDTEVQQHADTHRDIVINTPNTSPAATLRYSTLCTQQLSHPTLETVETPATSHQTRDCRFPPWTEAANCRRPNCRIPTTTSGSEVMSGPRSIWENYFRPSGEPQTSFEYYVRRQITLFKLIHTLIYYERSQQNAEAK